MDKQIFIISCPFCNRQIEINISESGEIITTLFCCDNGVEFGSIPLKGGEIKDE